MKAIDVARILGKISEEFPNTTMGTLKKTAEEKFGEIEWSSQMGYGEGMIICKFPQHEVEGHSSGLCTSEEALLNALLELENKGLL